MSDAEIRAILQRSSIPSTGASRAARLLGGYDTAAFTAMTIGELAYDRMSIDPDAIAAFEFAHKPSAGDIYKLANWAHASFDGSNATVEGRINRLQGYVFERVAASVLRQSGAVVELPSSATNPGWDLRVNGEEIQAKCGLSPHLVTEHLARHPDVSRLVVNEELASHFIGDDRIVAIGGVTRDLIREQTHDSLQAAADLLDLSMVRFAPLLSVVRNGWAVWNKETDTRGAVENIFVDGVTKLAGSKVGSVLGFAAAAALGGWPALLAPVIGASVGNRGASALAPFIKRQLFMRKETTALNTATQSWCAGCARIMGRMIEQSTTAEARFRAARARAEPAWTPIIEDWLQKLEAEQSYRQRQKQRFERASVSPSLLHDEATDPLKTAGHAMIAASRAGLLPSDLTAERTALTAAMSAYTSGSRRRLLS